MFVEQDRQVLVYRYHVLQWPSSEQFAGTALAEQIAQCPVGVAGPNQVPGPRDPRLVGLMQSLASQVSAPRNITVTLLPPL
jgi:hypothetical protein